MKYMPGFFRHKQILYKQILYKQLPAVLLLVFVSGLVAPCVTAARTEAPPELQDPLEVRIPGPREDVEPPPPPGETIEIKKPPLPPRGDQRTFWKKIKDAGGRFWNELVTMDHGERWRKHWKEFTVGILVHLGIGAAAGFGLFFLFKFFGLATLGAVLGSFAFGAAMLWMLLVYMMAG